MMLKNRYRLMAVTGLAAAALLGACGGDAKDTKAPAAAPKATVAAGGAGAVSVAMKDFTFEPSPASVSAGEMTFTAKNVGAVPHELAVVRSDADPKKLAVKDGLADETVSKPLARTKEIAAGASGTLSVKLEPGKYVLLCNLPGHYAAGMAAAFTVK